jgi:uncharacterized protein (DUF4415 family)
VNENEKNIGSDLAKVDAHVIAPEEYDDAPELDDDFFDRAVYHVGGVPMPKPLKDGASKGGRPRAEKPKVHTGLRLDADILEHFKAAGPGWQTRINATLRAAMEQGR